jgi:hypothetical protein
VSWCIQGLKDASRFTLISTTKALGSDTQINCLMSAQEFIILNTKEGISDFNGMRQHQGTAHLDYLANRLHVHPVDRSKSKGRKMHEIWSRSTNMSTGHEKGGNKNFFPTTPANVSSQMHLTRKFQFSWR